MRSEPVLAVDDDGPSRRLLVLALRDDYPVRAVASAEEAVEALREMVPAAVVTNVFMQGMDGIALVRHVRSDPRLARCRVVVASGASVQSRAFAAGADAFLEKPYPVRELVDVLHRLVGTGDADAEPGRADWTSKERLSPEAPMVVPKVHVAPAGTKWEVRRAGATRASSLHDSQADALRQARETAKREGAELVIQGRDGTIRDSDSFGNDRRDVRDEVH